MSTALTAPPLAATVMSKLCVSEPAAADVEIDTERAAFELVKLTTERPVDFTAVLSHASKRSSCQPSASAVVSSANV